MGGKYSSQSEFVPKVYPCFMPDDKECIERILRWINKAQKHIIVLAYRFSSQPIAAELIKARSRNVDVKIFVDKDADKQENNLIRILMENDIEVQVDRHKGRAHNKVMIIDKQYVITGSYNFTESYDKNSDVVIFIEDECVNKKYTEHYNLNIIMNKKRKYSGMLDDPYTTKSKCCFGLFPYDRLYAQFLTYSDRSNAQFLTYSDSSGDEPWLNLDSDGSYAQPVLNMIKRVEDDNYAIVDVCFPGRFGENCINLIVNYMASAVKLIYIQACSLTHKKIAEEIVRSHARGIDVKLLVDKKIQNDPGEKVSWIIGAGVPVKCDYVECGVAHSKTIVIDNDLILTGSFNLSERAQNLNYENLLHVRNKYVNKMFKEHFESMWEKSRDC